jgi:signal transduction histidine kinase
MNIATSEPSLYQLTQNLDEPLISLSIGAETLRTYVSAIIELLIEKQFRATVWIKLPQTKSWLHQVKALQQEGNTERIFICGSQKNHLSILKNTSTTPIIPIELKKHAILQRECFLIVSSAEFCSLALAQWQKGKIQIDSSGKRLQRPYLKMVSSFIPETIAPILSGVKDLSQGTAASRDRNFILESTTVCSDILSELILKQISYHETVQDTLSSLSKNHRTSQSSSTVLGLQEDFLNNLVRELRSPITHMKTALSLLGSKQIKGEQRQRYLKLVSNECERQNSLVSGLLELLLLDSPAQAEYLHLNDFVPGIVSTYQPLAQEKQIQLGYTIPANLPLISCPRSWFRQIIINLLNNSLQFTPAKGKVFVQASYKNEDEYVEVSVTDTGVGIPNKDINKIFDGFYRTKPTTHEDTGAGLGLTLVQQLVQRCGGLISVTSKVGKSTTFKILMPAVPVELSSTEV